MKNEVPAGRERPSEDSATIVQATDEYFMRIGELAQEFEVSLRTIRFYEDKGLLKPKRVGATRLFSRRDRARLKLIMLGRKVGFSLREVKQMLDMYKPGTENQRQYQYVLEKSQKQLDRLKKQRDELLEAMNDLQGVVHEIKGRLAEKAA